MMLKFVALLCLLALASATDTPTPNQEVDNATLANLTEQLKGMYPIVIGSPYEDTPLEDVYFYDVQTDQYAQVWPMIECQVWAGSKCYAPRRLNATHLLVVPHFPWMCRDLAVTTERPSITSLELVWPVRKKASIHRLFGMTDDTWCRKQAEALAASQAEKVEVTDEVSLRDVPPPTGCGQHAILQHTYTWLTACLLVPLFLGMSTLVLGKWVGRQLASCCTRTLPPPSVPPEQVELARITQARAAAQISDYLRVYS